MPGESGAHLLGNAAVTALALASMIVTFGPMSGAHLDPAVTLAARLRREVGAAVLAAFAIAQVAGAAAGSIAANVLYGLPAVTWSTTERSGWELWLSEALATFGLVLVVRLVGRRGRPAVTALAVGAYVGAAVVSTPSTCFANPAVTIARMLTDTFTGIAPGSVPPFVAAQIIGALAAVLSERLLLAEPRHGWDRSSDERG